MNLLSFLPKRPPTSLERLVVSLAAGLLVRLLGEFLQWLDRRTNRKALERARERTLHRQGGHLPELTAPALRGNLRLVNGDQPVRLSETVVQEFERVYQLTPDQVAEFRRRYGAEKPGSN